MDEIKEYFVANPHYFGLFMTVFGVVILISAIRGSNWLFKNDVSKITYSLKKLDGWINTFGVKTARIVAGISAVFIIAFGLFWFWMYAFYYK